MLEYRSGTLPVTCLHVSSLFVFIVSTRPPSRLSIPFAAGAAAAAAALPLSLPLLLTFSPLMFSSELAASL